MSAALREEEIERLVAERTEVRFRALIENSLDIVAILDAETGVKYVSPSVERILGYTVDELVGRMSLDFVHPDDAGVLAEIFERALLEPAVMETGEFRALHKDGTWRLLESVGTNMLDDPAVRGMVVTSRDVTARRALESRLVQAERLEAIGQLAGGVAHDFNNVLLVIRGYSSVLRATLEDDQQLADIDEIAKAADRAAELTRQLLAFGRRQVLQRRLVSLVDVVRGLESLLRRSLREDIAFELDLPDALPPVLTDPAQMEQVLLNLTVNARDAIEGTGTVHVAIEEAQLTGGETGIAPPLVPGRYLALSVTDSGSGIEEAVLPHIFEPFFTTKEDGVGTGLGLSTVYGIVVQSGGGIEVKRPAPGGTSFVAYLPVAAGAADDDAEAAVAASAHAAGSETILVVEDEQPVRELVRRVLEDAGYDVLTAALPSEAEELLDATADVALLLTDVVMPEMSGYELAQRVGERRPEIRTLFMSGYSHSVGGADRAQTLLKKPFAPEQLMHAVRDTLDGVAAR
jgi:two-component system, cell cycle sensor histidine kinase and response regulator CckA